MTIDPTKQYFLKWKRHEIVFRAVRDHDVEVLANALNDGALEVDSFRDDHGDTPLNVAAACGNYVVVGFLLGRGARTDIANNAGKTALAHAFEGGDKRCIKKLLTAGADISTLYENGFKNTVEEGVLDLARSGETPLLMKILDHVDMNEIKDSHADSLLNEAARFGHVGTVKALLERGAVVDDPNQEGRTALYWAMRDEHLDCVNLLISAGASMKGVQTTKMFQQLNDKLVKYAQKGDTETLLEQAAGFDLNIFVDDVGDSLLNEAARCGHFDTVKALVEAGATIDRAGSKHGYTALQWAVRGGYEEISLYLAEQGAATEGLKKLLDRDYKDETPALIQKLQNPHIVTAKRVLGEVHMVEVYDFKAQERISYIEGEKGYSAPVREFFYELRDRSALHQAFNSYAKRVRDAHESILNGPDAVPTLRKNKLPLKKHL